MCPEFRKWELFMKIDEKYAKTADKRSLYKTVKAFKKNGVKVHVYKKENQAVKKLFELIPKGAEIMNMTSTTLNTLNVPERLIKEKSFNLIRSKLNKMNNPSQAIEKKRLGSSQQYAIGSVQAVTESGQILIASNTGSQIPAYAYGAEHVIWVIGTQKIVKNLSQGIERIYKYCLPLENERFMKLYGKKSNVSKILIINDEKVPKRITIIFIEKNIGF